jgi:hypothetical protein
VNALAPLHEISAHLGGGKPTREQIERLEDLIAAAPHAHVAIEVENVFFPGVYCRKAFIKAGTVLTGKEHLTEHGNCCHGDLTVWTEDGMKRLTGFHTLVSMPGTKRVGYAHEDTVWMTIHPNPDDCRDVAELERRLVLPGRPLIAQPTIEILEAA